VKHGLFGVFADSADFFRFVPFLSNLRMMFMILGG